MHVLAGVIRYIRAFPRVVGGQDGITSKSLSRTYTWFRVSGLLRMRKRAAMRKRRAPYSQRVVMQFYIDMDWIIVKH